MQQSIADIMQKLLQLANEVDVDALSNVMEEFVEVFASELTPFAVQLTEQLVRPITCISEVLVFDKHSFVERYLSQDHPRCH